MTRDEILSDDEILRLARESGMSMLRGFSVDTQVFARAVERTVLERAKAPSGELVAKVGCACGDIYPADSYGAGYIDAAGCCPNCDSAPSAEPVAWITIEEDGTRHGLRVWSDGTHREVPLYLHPQPDSNQSEPLPLASHSPDLRVNPADGQDYGHLAGDKPAPTAQGAQSNGQPAPTDQGLPRTFAAGDRLDERDQDDGRTDGRAGGETAGHGRAGSAMDQHRGDGHAEGADGSDARRGAADVLLTEAELRAMYQECRASPEAEHTVWWILIARAVERAAVARIAAPQPDHREAMRMALEVLNDLVEKARHAHGGYVVYSSRQRTAADVEDARAALLAALGEQ